MILIGPTAIWASASWLYGGDRYRSPVIASRFAISERFTFGRLDRGSRVLCRRVPNVSGSCGDDGGGDRVIPE